MQTFNKHNIKNICVAIETDSIETAVNLTIKNKKTKSFILAGLVGQVVADYTVKNYKHDFQMDRLASYLTKLDSLQK